MVYRKTIHGNIPIEVNQIINALPNSGIVFKIANVKDAFDMGSRLSYIANKYELMYACYLSSTDQIRYIENNNIKIISLSFDTESG